MLAPYVDTTTWIPLAVFTASIIGSGHCVAMCGGLVAASSKSRASWAAYHLGRLLGYLLLGAGAGWIGGRIFEPMGPESAWLNYVSWSAALLMGASFLFAGFRIWQGRAVHLPILPSKVLSQLYKNAGNNALLLGLLTAFLPCGWLHSFVLGAIATRSPYLGAGFLFAFWLGTLPALGLAPWLVKRIFRPVSRRSPKLAALILISVGLMSVGMKVFPSALAPPQADEQRSCH